MPIRLCLLALLALSSTGLYAQDLVKKLKPQWTSPLCGDCGPIAVTEDAVILGTRSEDAKFGEVRCLDRTTGALRWLAQFPRGERYRDNPTFGVRSRPLIADGRVIVFTNRGDLACLDLDGFADNTDEGVADRKDVNDKTAADLIWRRDLVAELGVFKRCEFEMGLPSPHPTRVGERFVCATENGTKHNFHWLPEYPKNPSPNAPWLASFSLHDGATNWKNNEGGHDNMHSAIVTPLLLNDEKGRPAALVGNGSDGRFRKLEAMSGRTTWSTGPEQTFNSWVTPIDDGQRVIVTASKIASPWFGHKRVRIVAFDRQALLDSKTPIEPKWTFTDERYDGTLTPPVCANNMLFVVNNDAYLLAIDAETGKLAWIDDVSDVNVSRFAELRIASGKLIVPCGRELWIYEPTREKKLLTKVALDISWSICSGMNFSGEDLFVATDNNLYRFSAKEIFDGIK